MMTNEGVAGGADAVNEEMKRAHELHFLTKTACQTAVLARITKLLENDNFDEMGKLATIYNILMR